MCKDYTFNAQHNLKLYMQICLFCVKIKKSDLEEVQILMMQHIWQVISEETFNVKTSFLIKDTRMMNGRHVNLQEWWNP